MTITYLGNSLFMTWLHKYIGILWYDYVNISIGNYHIEFIIIVIDESIGYLMRQTASVKLRWSYELHDIAHQIANQLASSGNYHINKCMYI